MSRMIFDLTDEDRTALEAHRIRLGLRSHAETLRALIRGAYLPSDAERTALFNRPRSPPEFVKAMLEEAQPVRPDFAAKGPALKPWSGGHPKPGAKKR